MDLVEIILNILKRNTPPIRIRRCIEVEVLKEKAANEGVLLAPLRGFNKIKNMGRKGGEVQRLKAARAGRHVGACESRLP